MMGLDHTFAVGMTGQAPSAARGHRRAASSLSQQRQPLNSKIRHWVPIEVTVQEA